MNFLRSLEDLVDFLIDFPLGIALLFTDVLVQLSDAALLLEGNLRNLLLDRLSLGLDQVVRVVDFSTPVLRGRVDIDDSIAITALDGLNDVKEDFGVVEGVVRPDDVFEAGENHELILEREGRSLLNHPIEGIAHDSDKHVQERDLHDERREEEQEEAERGVSMALEAVHAELTEHQKVLAEDRVNQEVVEDRFDDGIVRALRVQLQHVCRTTRVSDHDTNDHHKVADIGHRPQDQGHVKRSRIEQSQPINDRLHALTEEDKAAQVSDGDHVARIILTKHSG